MVRKQNKEIEQIRLFVTNLMNEEQNAHSKLVADLRIAAGMTEEFNAMVAILKQVYEAKREVLDKVYKEMQGI